MSEIIVLRLVHVLGGIFWVGAGLFNLFYLGPAMVAAGPAAVGPIMATFKRRRMFVVMPAAAVLTLLSGLRLMMIQSSGFEAAYFQTGMGRTLALGGTSAILAFLIGVTVAMPAQARMGALGPQIAAAPDDATRTPLQARMGRLQRRVAFVTPLVTTLLVLAAVCMAIARYS